MMRVVTFCFYIINIKNIVDFYRDKRFLMVKNNYILQINDKNNYLPGCAARTLAVL